MSVLPLHGNLAAAREFDRRPLRGLGRPPRGVGGNPGGTRPRSGSAWPSQFQTWVDVVVADAEAIESTFNDAEAAFQVAALDDPSRQEIDTLFTPSEVRVLARSGVNRGSLFRARVVRAELR